MALTAGDRAAQGAAPSGTAAQLAVGLATVSAADLVDQLADAVILADDTGVVRLANAAAGQLFGCEPGTLVGLPLQDLMPERFRAAHQRGFDAFVTTGRGVLVGGPPIQVAALRADGSEVEVELAIGAIGRFGTQDFAVVATLRDVAGRVELERRVVLSRYLQATVEAAREGVLGVSPDRRVLAVNRKFCELWNLPEGSVEIGAPSPLIGLPLQQCVDPVGFRDAIDWGHQHPSETQSLEVAFKDGRVIRAHIAPIVDPDSAHLGRVLYLWDDTERRAIEKQRIELVDKLATAQRAQRFLLDASEVLAHASGFAETVEALAAVAVPTLGDLCLIDVLDERGELGRVAAVHADPGRRALVEELRDRYPPDPLGVHPSLDAINQRETRWSPEMLDDFLRATTRDERHFAIVKELEFTSYMCIPLIASDEVLGSITLVSAGSGRRFGESDVALAEDLAVRVALVVDKERRYDRQRVISHTLQASLLPSEAPVVDGLSIAVRYLPGTRDVEVGGDFWDVAELPGGDIAFAVGDVAGHDIVAAATMAQLRSACRALRARRADPVAIIESLQQTWEHLDLERIATAVFARLDRVSGRLLLATAGHPPPLIVGPDDVWFPSLEPASPLGAPSHLPDGWAGTLHAGAAIVLYTDGLVEDRHRDIDEGMDRLVHAARTSPSRRADELADHILAVLSSEDRADDVALLVIERLAR